MNFIHVSDENVAEYLRSNHYTELPKQGNTYTFLNDGKATFSETVKKRIVIDNKMNI